MKFASPPNPHEFNARVWEVARLIPEGRVFTYGQIASLITPPGGMSPKDYQAWGARWVGGAMAACPPDVPWQRVINAQGKISLRPGGGASQQRQILEAEGIIFNDNDRIDLMRFGWEGPDAGWKTAHGLPAQPSLFGD